MAKTTERTIPVSIILGATITNENGEIVTTKLEPVTAVGKLTNKQAAKELEKRFPGVSTVVVSVGHEVNKYSMETEKFIELAEKVIDDKAETVVQ